MRAGILLGVAVGFTRISLAQVQVLEEFSGPDEDISDPAVGTPADCSIAVSEEYIGVVVNKRVVFYERSQGIPEEDATDLATFFGTASGFDPRIAWDNSWDDDLGQNGAYRDQFLLSFLVQADIFVGWSPQGVVEPLGVANDPNESVWQALNRDGIDSDYDCGFTDNEHIKIDQPTLGYDDRAWYISAPTAEVTGIGVADRINDFIYIIPKDPSGPNDVKLVYSDDFENAAGNPLRCFVADGIAGLQGREVAVAAVHRGGESPAAYFVGIGAKGLSTGGGPNPCAGGEFNVIRLYAIGDPLNDEAPFAGDDADVYELRFHELTVPCFNASNANVPDKSGETFRGGDGRISSATWVDLDGLGYIYACHSVRRLVSLEKFPPQPGGGFEEQLVVRWYVIKTNGWPDSGTPTLLDWGEIDAGTVDIGGPGEIDERPVHLIYPSIAANELGDFGMVMCQTSIDEKISIQATAKWEFEDDPEPLVEVEVSPSVGPHPTGSWGDYTGVTVDPWINPSGDSPR